ncbi:acyl-CoA esterase [compost metagenome]
MGAYTIDQMADDVAGLMEALGVTQYALLGHSMGGYAALSLAQRYASRLNALGLIHST